MGYRRRWFKPIRRAKLPPGYRRLKKGLARDLQSRLDNVVIGLRDDVESIAKEFTRSPAWVRGQLFGGSKNARFLRRVRKTRLYDAYLHFRTKEINGDLPSGSKKQLQEIKEIISRERRNYKMRPAEEQAVWIAEYEADKENAAREKRVNRKGEQQDASSALKRISVDLSALFTRTGVRAMLIAVRSDILFTMNPYIYCDDNTEKFLSVALGKTSDQIARAMEMWTIHGPSGLANAPNNAAELKAEVRNFVQTRLDDVLAKRYPVDPPSIKMNYVSYDSAIVARYGVRLHGWDVPMVNPGNLAMDDARKMYNGFINQTVYWEPVPDPTGDEDPGVVATRKRKKRADAGKPRGPNKRTRTANETDAEGSKRAKKRKKRTRDDDDDTSDSGGGSTDDE